MKDETTDLTLELKLLFSICLGNNTIETLTKLNSPKAVELSLGHLIRKRQLIKENGISTC